MSTKSNLSEDPMNSNRIANTGFKKLIGEWNTEGRILASDQNAEMGIKGWDTYELILDGNFILHKADVLMGTEKSQTHEIIGLEKTSQRATLQHFNNQGSSGKMTGTLDNNELKIDGQGLRFRGQFLESGSQIHGTWERLDNKGSWERFLEMKLTKAELK